MSDFDTILMERIDQVSRDLGDIAVQVGKIDSITSMLKDHETRLKSVEAWQARLIGGYAVAMLVLGAAFHFATGLL